MCDAIEEGGGWKQLNVSVVFEFVRVLVGGSCSLGCCFMSSCRTSVLLGFWGSSMCAVVVGRTWDLWRDDASPPTGGLFVAALLEIFVVYGFVWAEEGYVFERACSETDTSRVPAEGSWFSINYGTEIGVFAEENLAIVFVFTKFQV